MRTLSISSIKRMIPLEIMEYIQLIHEETDINHIDTLIQESCSIYTTDKQVSWIRSESTARKIELNNFLWN